jgi:tetratricopeptide (TPR) repeat protein
MEFDPKQHQKSSSIDTVDPVSPPGDSDGGTKTSDLLRQGRAFLNAGHYQQAINVWTRILFLDRGNLAAREAIDKAKRSMAERQRELDALVGEAAKRAEKGERPKAKRLLARVLTLDPRHTEGRGLWEKIEATERRAEAQSNGVTLTTDLPGGTTRLRRRSAGQKNGAKTKKARSASPLKMAVFLFCAFCLLALGGLYLHLNWDFLVSDSAFATSRQEGPGTANLIEHPQVPMPSDLHYYNGARLHAKGQYRDALAELARVERGTAFYEDARGLILRIEERLLRESVNAEVSSNIQTSGEKR